MDQIVALPLNITVSLTGHFCHGGNIWQAGNLGYLESSVLSFLPFD